MNSELRGPSTSGSRGVKVGCIGLGDIAQLSDNQVHAAL